MSDINRLVKQIYTFRFPRGFIPASKNRTHTNCVFLKPLQTTVTINMSLKDVNIILICHYLFLSPVLAFHTKRQLQKRHLV